MRIVTIVVAIGATIFMVGCGAIMHGTQQDISINSSPNEAQVTVQGDQKTTPAVFKLKRKHSYILKISKEGYESSEVMINNKLDWTAWCDLFVWGVLPIFYDLSSGAAWKLSPEEINATLNRKLGSIEGPEQIQVGLSLKGDQLSLTSPVEGITATVMQTQ